MKNSIILATVLFLSALVMTGLSSCVGYSDEVRDPVIEEILPPKHVYKEKYDVRLPNRALVIAYEGNNGRIFKAGDTVCIHNLAEGWIIDNEGKMENDTISNFYRIGIIE